MDNTARSILQDWNSGRIPYYSVPPVSGAAVESHIATEIVSSWSAEFSLPDVVAIEGKELESIRGKSQISHRMVALNGSLGCDIDMDMKLPEDSEEDMME